MGALNFEPHVLIDELSEQVGFKAGLALTIQEIFSHLEDTPYYEAVVSSETGGVRLRSEDYEGLFYTLLHNIGHTEERYDGDRTGAFIWHKYKESREVVAGVTDLLLEMWPKEIDKAASTDEPLDPTPFIEAAGKKYGELGKVIAIERVLAIHRSLTLSPYTRQRMVEWVDAVHLGNLFTRSESKPSHGQYIDQRFIDYLSVNTQKMHEMHWRKFEQMTAEFFDRAGFRVSLGTGGNDEGVDIRIWDPSESSQSGNPPTCIVQCKRQREKIDKVTVKGLYSDVQYEQASYGLLVTTSELSRGARKTITARGYPVVEINSAMLKKWLDTLRTPGTGVVRS